MKRPEEKRPEEGREREKEGGEREKQEIDGRWEKIRGVMIEVSSPSTKMVWKSKIETEDLPSPPSIPRSPC
jgi:hypothetical protein